MASPLLARTVEFEDGESLTITIAAPTASERDASCEVVLSSMPHRPFRIVGIDAMQALGLAIQFADRQLDAIADGRRWNLGDE